MIWLEILLAFGVPLAWGFWQLHTLRRDRRALAARRAAVPIPPNPATPK